MEDSSDPKNQTTSPTDQTQTDEAAPGQSPEQTPSGEAVPPTPESGAETPTEEPAEGSQPTVGMQPGGGKSGGLKWLLTVVVILLLIGGGYLAWHHYNNSKKTESVTTVKEIPLVRYGSINGPIGSKYVFPNAPAASLSSDINFQIYEGLTAYEGERVVPQLATSWTNPDQNTWVFQLAKNVKFQNGDTMTATDVAGSIEADLQNDGYNSYLSTIASAKATGPDQVTVTTSQPDALLLGRLAYAFVFKTSGNTYYGTGPYTLDTTKPNGDTTTWLKAFEGYHGGRPKTQEVNYIAYQSDQDVLNAFKAHKLDAFENKLANVQASVGGNVASVTYQLPGSTGLYMDMLRPGSILTNVKLREAIAYAIDRTSLVKDEGNNNDALPTQQILPKSVVGYDASATFPNFDLAKSKQLQAAAGYPNGAPLTFLYIKGTQQAAPYLISQLDAAGFKVTDDGVADPNAFMSQLQSGKVDLFYTSQFSNFNDGTDVFASLLDSQDSTFPVYNNPQFDAMITAAEQAFDPATHLQKVQAINRYIASNYLWIPFNTSVFSRYSVPNYQIVPNYSDITSSNSFWKDGQTVTTSSSSTSNY